MDVDVGNRRVALLRLDPDLAVGLSDEERQQAESLVRVPELQIDVGPLALGPDQEPSLGVMLISGFVTMDVRLGDQVTSQLVGPGDVLLQTTGAPEGLLPAVIAHQVSERARAVVLDRIFLAAVRRWPTLLLTLHERLRIQEQRATTYAAIAKLSRADDRVVALLWHLAERWGRVGVDGTLLPLSLTHEAIGRLIGARRPTVSLALSELARDGHVHRRDDGAFVLDPASLERLEHKAPLRHASLTVVRTADAPELPPPVTERPYLVDVSALHARIAALREGLTDRATHTSELLERSRESVERSAVTRAQVTADRARSDVPTPPPRPRPAR
jgi:CRP/FNR family transcriptional regulator, cyclic AMP receptor protein